MEMSHARRSSALGVRPTPYVGDCASAETPMSGTRTRALSVPIGHAPIAGDLPRLNGVVETRHAVGRCELRVPVLGDLRSRRLNLANLVRAAREELGRLSVPGPPIGEPGMRHALRS